MKLKHRLTVYQTCSCKHGARFPGYAPTGASTALSGLSRAPASAWVLLASSTQQRGAARVAAGARLHCALINTPGLCFDVAHNVSKYSPRVAP